MVKRRQLVHIFPLRPCKNISAKGCVSTHRLFVEGTKVWLGHFFRASLEPQLLSGRNMGVFGEKG